MSYSAELEFGDYTIVFDYDYDPKLGNLFLEKWQAYEGNEEVNLPCVVTSSFVETEINKFLDYEWVHNGTNYLEDYEHYLMEKRYADN